MAALRALARHAFWVGLAAIAAYFFSIHPVGFSSLGYSEDICYYDLMRQLLSGILETQGGPHFHTDQFQAPFSASIPFMSWGLERDWLGAYFWRWDPRFPFHWAYFGVSLLVTYVGVGTILARMGLGRAERWALAALVVVFNVPRHFKTWHHYEHLAQHWVYLGVFLDAWVWRRFTRESRWSPRLELWRFFLLLGMFGTAGYYWGPMILEWTLVRGFMAAVAWRRSRREGRSPRSLYEVEPLRADALWPVGLGLALLVVDLRWYLPLFREARQWGEIPQRIGFYAHLGHLVRPLWAQPFLNAWVPKLANLEKPETVVTVGWVYWVPFGIALRQLRRRAGGPGWIVAGPFLALLAVAIVYMNFGDNIFHWPIQHLVPFMKFFRVASRWGLLLTPILGAALALAWPELRRRATGIRRPYWALAGALALLEFAALATPPYMMSPLPAPARAMLERVRDLPGDTVLDLPFCVTGGNQGCAEEQCSFYPASVAGACMRVVHGKKISGLYQARISEAQCEVFRRPPYQGWFAAWREDRCFNAAEWDGFCGYLRAQPSLSAVLVYPEVWKGAGAPACAAEFERHLGAPRGVSGIQLSPTRGGEGAGFTRIVWYGNRCRE